MATKQASKNEVATQQQGDLSTAFSQDVPEWAKEGNRGNENVGTDDIVLPRLEIVQAQSPIKDTDENAAEGMLFNSATSELLGNQVYLIPVYYRMEFLIWKDQDAGGGFFGAYQSKDEAAVRLQEVISDGEDPDNLEIVDTPVHYCLLIVQAPDGKMTTQQIVVSMAKSKAKVSRKWNAAIQIAGGDRFARVYKISTFKDKNKQNKTFQNFVVQPAGFAPKDLYDKALTTYDYFKSADLKVAHDTVIDNEGGGVRDDI